MTADDFSPPRPLFFRLALVLAAILASPAAFADGKDPVLVGVQDLLAAEMPESVVLEWLEAQDPGPAVPSSEELIELRRSGASERLLRRILQVAGSGTPRPARPARPIVGDPRDHTKPMPRSRVSAAPRPSPVPKPATGPVPVTFSLSYAPYFLEGEEEWQLYVYLDGEPLAYVPSGGVLGGKPLTFVRRLSPGRHQVRITRELHEDRRRKPTHHRARVADLEIPLEVAPGEAVDFELKFRQSILSSKNPVSYRISKGSEVTHLEEEVGGHPDRWQEICDDIRLSSPGKPDRSTGRRLQKCVEWGELWTAADGPDREQILKAMSRFNYRPVPREQSLH